MLSTEYLRPYFHLISFLFDDNLNKKNVRMFWNFFLKLTQQKLHKIDLFGAKGIEDGDNVHVVHKWQLSALCCVKAQN